VSTLWDWLVANRDALIISLVSSAVSGFVGIVVGHFAGRRAERLAGEREVEKLRSSLQAAFRRNVTIVRSLPEAIMIDSNLRGPDLAEIAATANERRRLGPVEREAVADAHAQLGVIDELLRRFTSAQHTTESRRHAVEITQKVPDAIAACEKAIEALGGSIGQSNPPPAPIAA